MNMEHVEVLRNLSEVCRASIKAGDWKVDGACDPDAVLRRADSAIAALSAPQPPAEAQPVAWEWEYIGVDQYPRGHKVARSLREMDPTNPPYPETWRPTRPLIYGDTAPPSASVGVEAKHVETLRRVIGLLRDTATLQGREHIPLGIAFTDAIDHFHALAQQPAAVDEAMLRDAERYRALVASGKFAPSFNSGWALATGTYRATKDELDAAADALAAQQGGSDNG